MEIGGTLEPESRLQRRVEIRVDLEASRGLGKEWKTHLLILVPA